MREVSVLSVDRDLRDAVPPAERPLAERAIRAACVRLPQGPWEPTELMEDADPTTTALVLHGLVTREIGLPGTPSAYLHGAGDLLMPWDRVSHALPFSTTLTVGAGGADLVILGEAFRRAEQRWPQLAISLQQRFAAQTKTIALHTAIMSLPRSEDRILALFWHLAERWGTVHPDGVKVRLKLTHELIGRLTGSKRPTVSLALAQLAEEGLLRFEGGVGWRLDHGSAAALRDGSYRSPTEDASSRPAASLLA